ncbi:hypothetical protein [Agrobacterium larrymoorei]|uniref:Uncharacterized protein n=1 Tax=Agrobacterium larrymoorei TaxID=160699 RepID=A0AAF0H968_9HYPH|nr:hypothetical protein [Agrobacterium larrymoorei]WHA40164.1 hypothetical protein CFBP5477_009985 [Agrobacterium larrymoorei]
MKGWFRADTFSFKGQDLTLYEIARRVGMPPETLRNRVLNIGLTVDEAVAIDRLPPAGGVKAKRYWFRDEFLTIKQHAANAGCSEDALRARIIGDRVLETDEAREANSQFRDPPSNACLVTYKGKTQYIAEWSRELGIDQKTLAARLGHYQWSVEKALTTPVDQTRTMVHVRRRNRQCITRITIGFRRIRNQQIIHRISTACHRHHPQVTA